MPFIGICGDICSGKCYKNSLNFLKILGKETIANYLIEKFDFSILKLKNTYNNNINLDDLTLLNNNSKYLNKKEGKIFNNAIQMLNYVTRHWREKFVTIDISSQEILKVFSKRPFFLLIGVNSPVMLRWNRYKEWYV